MTRSEWQSLSETEREAIRQQSAAQSRWRHEPADHQLRFQDKLDFWYARDVYTVQGCLFLVLAVILLPVLALPVVLLLAGLQWLVQLFGG